MRGRGGFLELGTKFENVFLLHILKSPTNYVSEKLPPFSGVHKVPQKEPFIVRPGWPLVWSAHWSVHKISFLLLLSGVCEESRRTGSGKFDNLRPNLINGALKSAVQGSFAGQKGPHPVQSTAQFLKDLPIQDEVKTAETR